MITKSYSLLAVGFNKGLMSSKICAFLVVTFNEIGSLRDFDGPVHATNARVCIIAFTFMIIKIDI